jgi:hypothetical protein
MIKILYRELVTSKRGVPATVTHSTERLAKDGRLMTYRHDSLWRCMDTLRNKIYPQELRDSGSVLWKV